MFIQEHKEKNVSDGLHTVDQVILDDAEVELNNSFIS